MADDTKDIEIRLKVVDEMTPALAKASDGLKGMGKAAENAVAPVKKVGTETKETTAHTYEFGKALGKAADPIRQLDMGLGKIVKGFIGVGAIMMTWRGINSVVKDAVANFEKARPEDENVRQMRDYDAILKQMSVNLGENLIPIKRVWKGLLVEIGNLLDGGRAQAEAFKNALINFGEGGIKPQSDALLELNNLLKAQEAITNKLISGEMVTAYDDMGNSYQYLADVHSVNYPEVIRSMQLEFELSEKIAKSEAERARNQRSFMRGSDKPSGGGGSKPAAADLGSASFAESNMFGPVALANESIAAPAELGPQGISEDVAAQMFEAPKKAARDMYTLLDELQAEHTETYLAGIEDAHARELADIEVWYAQQTEKFNQFGMDKTQLNDVYNAKLMNANKKAADERKRIEERTAMATLDTVGNMVSALGAIMKEAGKQNKEAAKAAKALAIVAAVIDTASAAIKAYKSMADIPVVGSVLGGIAAGAAIALGAVQIATIASQNFARGGVVQGPSAGDQVPINANGGEMILTQAQQTNLFESINRGNTGGGQTVNINIGSITSENKESVLAAFRANLAELVYHGQLAQGVLV
jgi:hypothetical protein